MSIPGRSCSVVYKVQPLLPNLGVLQGAHLSTFLEAWVYFGSSSATGAQPQGTGDGAMGWSQCHRAAVQLRSAEPRFKAGSHVGKEPPLWEHWERWDAWASGPVPEQDVPSFTGLVLEGCDLSASCGLCLMEPYGSEYLANEMRAFCQCLERAPPRPRRRQGEGIIFLPLPYHK